MIEVAYQLTNRAAYAASGLVATSYVGVLYAVPSARARPWQTDESGRKLDRLHPEILKARLWAVGFSTLLSILLVGILVKATSGPLKSPSIYETFQQTMVLIGLKAPTASWEYLRLILEPVILTVILFWGPLYSYIFLESKLSGAGPSPSWKYMVDIYVLRAIVIGPLLEEVVFRGCIIGFHLLVPPHDQLSKTQLIFISPLWFGLAHVHGIWETYLSLGKTNQALIMATIRSGFQFVYTTIFGWYAAFIYLQTGSVIAAVLCHSFCNFMSLPPLFQSLQQFPHKRTSIAINYLVGLLLFVWLLTKWANNPTSQKSPWMALPKSD